MFDRTDGKSTSVPAFVRDTKASIGVLAALSLSAILLFAGATVDLLRWQQARQATTAALDAAVLAGGQALVIDPLNTDLAIEAAERTYQASVSDRIPVGNDNIHFAIDTSQQTVTAVGSVTMSTTLLNAVGISELGLVSDGDTRVAKAEVSSGGPLGGGNLELALALDVSGSMCDDGFGPCKTGAKLNALKAAAANLITIAVKADQSHLTSKVALVPFADQVRIGADGSAAELMKRLTNLDETWSGVHHSCTSSAGSVGSETTGDWSCGAWSDVSATEWQVAPCVTERLAAGGDSIDVSDDVPAPGHWLNGQTQAEAPAAAAAANYDPDGACSNTAAGEGVLPLTSDRAAALARIDNLQAYGATDGALGASWAWYMLAPQWNAIWRGEGAPAAYADPANPTPADGSAAHKVAVLMTDGAFNALRGQKDEDQQTVSSNALEVCQAMKGKGIEVYTVGFGLDRLGTSERGIATATLQACATDASHFYDSSDAAQLATAFQDIGIKLSSLRLAN